MVGRSLLQAENPGPNPGGATRIETVGPARRQPSRPRIRTPGSSPEAMTTLVYIADFRLFFQSPASGRSTAMDRAHEYPLP